MDEKEITQMNLTDISVVRRLLSEQETNFKKKFGQNFLINKLVVERIADECGADEKCGVLEIGPGIGVLTRELSRVSGKVVAVEIDGEMVEILKKTLSDLTNVKVINSDVMKLSLPDLIKEEFADFDSVRVCANLPYYITTPILMALLESGIPFRSITVMVQKEVADRLTSSAGDDDYGAITAAISYYGKAKRLFTVRAGNFMPAPRVDSAVLRIDLYEKPPVSCDREKLMKVIRSAFGQRRKTLVNALTSAMPEYGKEKIVKAVTECGFSETVRGEKLTLADFAKITDAIFT